MATPAATVNSAKLIVEVKEFDYSPNQFTVKVGQPLEIVLKNMGVTVHDFTIEKISLNGKAVANGDTHDMSGMGNTDSMGHMNGMDAMNPDQLSVHVAAEQGHEGTVTFTPTEAGTYEFYCTVPGHKASGMVGKLIVVNP